MSTKLITDTMRIDRLYDDYRALQAQIAEALKLAGAYAVSLHGPRDIVDTVKTLQAVLGREIEEHQRHHDADAALLTERDELREALGRYLTAAEREVRPHHTECHDMDIPAEECPTCSRLLATYARDRAIISRHPAQPVKGTPGG